MARLEGGIRRDMRGIRRDTRGIQVTRLRAWRARGLSPCAQLQAERLVARREASASRRLMAVDRSIPPHERARARRCRRCTRSRRPHAGSRSTHDTPTCMASPWALAMRSAASFGPNAFWERSERYRSGVPARLGCQSRFPKIPQDSPRFPKIPLIDLYAEPSGGPGPPGPHFVFCFCFPPPTRPLQIARPPTDREIKNAPPCTPLLSTYAFTLGSTGGAS
jgi:hypothetical protein